MYSNLLLSRTPPKLAIGSLVLVALLVGCSTISPFNESAYQQAINVKVSALALIDKATEPYAKHHNEVDTLMRAATQAYEYAKGRPQNEESTQQWHIMIDPERKMLAGFMKKWKSAQGNGLSQPFVDLAKQTISGAFDSIIRLESGKRKN